MTLFAACIGAVIFICVGAAMRFGVNHTEWPSLDPALTSDEQYWTTVVFAALQFTIHALAIVIARPLIDSWLQIDSFSFVFYCVRDTTWHNLSLLLLPATLVTVLLLGRHSVISSQ